MARAWVSLSTESAETDSGAACAARSLRLARGRAAVRGCSFCTVAARLPRLSSAAAITSKPWSVLRVERMTALSPRAWRALAMASREVGAVNRWMFMMSCLQESGQCGSGGFQEFRCVTALADEALRGAADAPWRCGWHRAPA